MIFPGAVRNCADPVSVACSPRSPRILSDQKNKYPFIFGDIRTKDLKRWNIQPRRPDTTAGLAGPAADAEAASVQDTLETINVRRPRAGTMGV